MTDAALQLRPSKLWTEPALEQTEDPVVLELWGRPTEQHLDLPDWQERLKLSTEEGVEVSSPTVELEISTLYELTQTRVMVTVGFLILTAVLLCLGAVAPLIDRPGFLIREFWWSIGFAALGVTFVRVAKLVEACGKV